MSFEERLRALRDKEISEAELKKTREEELKRLKQEREKERRVELERLAKIAGEKLTSLLESVNRVYCGGDGDIALEKKIYESSMNVELKLEWRTITGGGFEQLWLTLEENLDVIAKGAAKKSPVTKFNLKDEDWEQKAKEGIYTIMSDRSACFIPPEEPPRDWSVS